MTSNKHLGELMETPYKELTSRVMEGVAELDKEIPDVIAGFRELNRAATAAGSLDYKTRELIALAIGVAGHCEGCIAFHTQALAKDGATRLEVAEALGVAVYMGGGPSLMYAAEAINAFDEACAALG